MHRLLMFLVVVAACTEPRPRHPLAGSYEITTKLDSFQFETSYPSLPDCSYEQGSCTRYRAFTGAELSGVLDLGIDSTATEILRSAGTFHGLKCDSIDYTNLTGCTHVAPHEATYVHKFSELRSFAGDSSFVAYVVVQTAEFNPPLIWFAGKFAGDSIFGDVAWYDYQGRSPPAHTGTFVGRRR